MRSRRTAWRDDENRLSVRQVPSYAPPMAQDSKSGIRMHDEEVERDVARVRQLLQEQFLKWADLSIEPVRSAGTDNAMFRLGNSMVARLPRTPAEVAQVERETSVAAGVGAAPAAGRSGTRRDGTPGEGYCWTWSVYRWLDGENATTAPPADLHHAALELAGFVNALRRIDNTNGRRPGSHDFNRGVSLTQRAAHLRGPRSHTRGYLRHPCR